MIVVPFTPKYEKETAKNLHLYVEHIQKHAIFFKGKNAVEWDTHVWELTKFFPTTGNVRTTAIFLDRPGKNGKPFSQPFMDEAKAILTDYLQQSKTRQVSKLIAVLRKVYQFTPEFETKKTINSLSDIQLYAIENSISEQYLDSYSLCNLLESLMQNYVEPAKLTRSRLSWRSGQKYKSGGRRTDLVGERNSVTNTPGSRLPKLRCILDLASVFNSSNLKPDMVVTSWFAISMYAPSRINEILSLPVDCERYDEGTPGSGHGIAWLPVKGGDPLVKRAVSEESAQVARAAIERLRKLGESARIASRWYEENPLSLFLPEKYEHLRGEPITPYEIGMIIGIGEEVPSSHIRSFGMKPTKFTSTDKSRTNRKGWVRLYEFDGLEKYVINKLPYGWPYANPKTRMKFSEALFTMPLDIMRSQTRTCANIPQFITSGIIQHQLKSVKGRRSIFSRNNLCNPETGEFWSLSSHQPRHLLNTIAQSKHLSQELIAFWSGRKNVKQNEYYDHTSQEFLIQAYLRLEEDAPQNLIVTGPLAGKLDTRAANEPITRDEAMKEELGAFHLTKYGYCRHDFSLTPCPKDKWCNNCGEAYFSKGDVRQIKMAKQDVAKFTKSLATAKQAKANGEYGVEQWLEKLEIDLYRASLKLEKLTDPALEDGTLITLPPPTVSQSKAGLSIAIRDTENSRQKF